MAVIALDRAHLSRSLRPLARHQRGAFAVSCAQRLAACFLRSPMVQQERPDDLRLAQQVLAELWTASVTDLPERLLPLVTELERMPELTAYEQWRGRGAYQTHALAAMLYASRTWEEQSPNYVVQCTQCVFDAALFLDRRLDPAPVDPLSESALRASRGRSCFRPERPIPASGAAAAGGGPGCDWRCWSGWMGGSRGQDASRVGGLLARISCGA
jgi:hypothetical protein